jgi:hypothetical protein
MHDGAFLFHPLRVYDGDSSLSLEGTARFRRVAGTPTFDLVVGANGYSVARILDYLDIDLPVDGRVTGQFPVSGDPPDRLSGGGAATLENAVLWGQSVPKLTGRAELTPGRFTLDDVRAEIGGGAVGGHGRSRTARRPSRCGPPATRSLSRRSPPSATSSDRVSGRLSFELSGSGAIDRPDVTLSASLSDAQLFGRAVPEARMPKLRAHLAGGRLEASAAAGDLWSLSATGDVAASPMEFHARLDAKDLAALMSLTPSPPPEGVGGSVSAEGVFRVPEEGRGELSGEVTILEARFDARGREGLLRTASAAKVRIGAAGSSSSRCASSATTSTFASRRARRVVDSADDRRPGRGHGGRRDPRAGRSGGGPTGRLDVEVAVSGPIEHPPSTARSGSPTADTGPRGTPSSRSRGACGSAARAAKSRASARGWPRATSSWPGTSSSPTAVSPTSASRSRGGASRCARSPRCA